MVQLRNVPDDLHQKLKARAAKARMSLSEYLLREVEQIATRPTLDEFRDIRAKLPKTKIDTDITALIRSDRESR